MKNLSVILLLAVGAWEMVAAYTTKYDNIDLDEILGNERLYKKYFDCLTGEGKCTPDGQELKDIIPEALENKCAKCNEKQKNGAEKVLKFAINDHPAEWDRLAKIYDPEGKYKAMYKDEAKTKYGVDVK